MDALRTRSELACFRESPEVQKRVERLLTYYCKTSGISCVNRFSSGVDSGRNNINKALTFVPFCHVFKKKTAYKQGLNEVAAPFIYIALPVEEEGDNGGESEALALKSFKRFIRLFLRNMYTDEVRCS